MQADDLVDSYLQSLSLLEPSYRCQAGTDAESNQILKRDLFVQKLLLKWKGKVLPSATTFVDALYQARAAEEQEKQLQVMH